MAIPTTDLDIGTRYALQEDFNNGFVGRDRQVVIQTDDPKGYRPVIMDGTTQGGKSKVALLTDLSDYVPVDTYNSEKAGFETKSNASATYETKANASATYATKSELTSGLAGKAASVHTHEIANVNGLQTALNAKADSSALANYATKTELSDKADVSSVPVITSSTTDLEAGTSPLATGQYYFVYE